uniref:Uncharacterized protein n=1 Tax=Molossus molossus TaxID=27622 RepID=A0A7J8ERT1_MOLMO|nr:hypothetical protein HJG59_008714 [Molossus molossus]
MVPGLERHTWGKLGTGRPSGAGGVGRPHITLGPCSASIYSSRTGDEHFDLGSQHAPPALAFILHQQCFWPKDWGKTGAQGRLMRCSLRVIRQEPLLDLPSERVVVPKIHHWVGTYISQSVRHTV